MKVNTSFLGRYVKDEDVKQFGWPKLNTGVTWLPYSKQNYNAFKIRVGKYAAWFGFKFAKESK